MEKLILALDQGTTSSRAILFDKQGNIHAQAQKEFKQIYPKPGWVEHDANEIWQSQLEVARNIIQDNKIAAIGITNQRETTVVWNKETSEPIYNAIVWQDRRTAKTIDGLKERGLTKLFQNKTGLVLDAYFSATKIAWILDNIDGARQLAERGLLAFGTIDSWLVYKLSQGKLHITDVSNASRTLVFNINNMSWDDELLKIFDIPISMLPKVVSSSAVYGNATVFNDDIPIAGIAGDQHAATFGQTCFNSGEAKNTYGTGCFLMMNTGQRIIESKNNLLTTVAWQAQGATDYALEGSVFIAGAIVQWLRDELGIIKDAAEVEELALSVNDNGGVYLVPALTGLGAPHWDQYARGLIIGLSRGTGAKHIARAALESIAFQTYDILQAMQADSGVKLKQLRVDGGAANNDFLMQFQADLLNVEVVRPKITETTALGAAYLAGLAVGYWSSEDEIHKLWAIDKVFKPGMAAKTRESLLKAWQKALNRSKDWAEE